MKILSLFVAASACASAVALERHTAIAAHVVLIRSGILSPEDGSAMNGNCTASCSNLITDIRQCDDDDDDCFCTAGVRADFIQCSECNASQDPSLLSKLQDKADQLVHKCSDSDKPIESISLRTSQGSSTEQSIGGAAGLNHGLGLAPWIYVLGSILWTWLS